MVVTLGQLHGLREKPPSMSRMLAPTNGDGPEHAADALLDQLDKMAWQATLEPGLAGVTIDRVQMALYRNITVPARGLVDRPPSGGAGKQLTRSP